jgi:hypothetical protein
MILSKTDHMKNSRTQSPKQNIQFNTNRRRPENKDNLDSREGEEQLFKGDDVTHNQKAHKNKKSEKKDKK